MLKQFKHKASPAVSFFLILAYAFVTFGSLFHSHEPIDHSHTHSHVHEITLEEHILISSACHNSIYHNVTNDCGHREHFSEVLDKCFTCDFYLSKKAVVTNDLINSKPEIILSKELEEYLSFYSQDFFQLKPSRGPPVFVS